MNHRNQRKKREVKAIEKEAEDEPGSDADALEIQEIKKVNHDRIELQCSFMNSIEGI